MRTTGSEIIRYTETILASRGLSMGSLGKAEGIPAARFSMWKKKNRSPTLDSLIHICHFLNISLNELIDYPDPNANEEFPKEIKEIAKMLLEIEPQDLTVVEATVKAFYNNQLEKKEKASQTLG